LLGSFERFERKQEKNQQIVKKFSMSFLAAGVSEMLEEKFREHNNTENQ